MGTMFAYLPTVKLAQEKLILWYEISDDSVWHNYLFLYCLISHLTILIRVGLMSHLLRIGESTIVL